MPPRCPFPLKRALVLSDPDATFMTSLNLNYLFKALSPNMVISGVRALAYAVAALCLILEGHSRNTENIAMLGICSLFIIPLLQWVTCSHVLIFSLHFSPLVRL